MQRSRPLSSGALELKDFFGIKNAEKQTFSSGALELKDFLGTKNAKK